MLATMIKYNDGQIELLGAAEYEDWTDVKNEAEYVELIADDLMGWPGDSIYKVQQFPDAEPLYYMTGIAEPGCSTKIKVAEGIMDTAAEEHRAENLKNIAAVQAYAENGCNIRLTDSEAEHVLSVCRDIQKRLDEGEKIDWYHDLEKKLSNEKGK